LQVRFTRRISAGCWTRAAKTLHKITCPDLYTPNTITIAKNPPGALHQVMSETLPGVFLPAGIWHLQLIVPYPVKWDRPEIVEYVTKEFYSTISPRQKFCRYPARGSRSLRIPCWMSKNQLLILEPSRWIHAALIVLRRIEPHPHTATGCKKYVDSNLFPPQRLACAAAAGFRPQVAYFSDGK